MKPIPIALCITDLDPGGAERQMAGLVARVDRERFRPVVYCLGPRPAREDASCVPLIERAGIECHCLGGRGGRQFLKVTGRLTALLKSQAPAILQSFLFHANLVGRIAARRAGVPRVVCGLRVAEREQRWHLWLDRVTQAKVDRYVCVSQAVADFSVAKGHLPAEKLVVIPNGVDPARYPAAVPADLVPLGVPPGVRVAVCVGRLARQKGQEWLLRSAPRWLENLSDCHLLLVGDGPDRSRLERLAQQTGLSGRVHFAGYCGNVAGILAASTVLILPSVWEGMPNAVLEAMASRLPVVASDVEGIRELLGPLAAMQTVPYGDDLALAARIESILSERSTGCELAEQNRLRVEEHFSQDTTCRAYEQLWQSLVDG
ncbi:MAG: glycosyltransferase [Thermoguttaceae bacterium]|nr:glycosyltransferase [Thermoguttaceae bacterium]